MPYFHLARQSDPRHCWWPSAGCWRCLGSNSPARTSMDSSEGYAAINRRFLAQRLLQRDLLRADEVDRFAKSVVLPAGVEQRVRETAAAANPVEACDGVSSTVIIPAAPFERIEPSVLTYNGPRPTELSNRKINYSPALLYQARTAKIYIGPKQTTLILDPLHYFRGVSTPASQWIAPALGGEAPSLILRGTAAILFANSAQLFSHWMFDLLPKFEILRRAGWHPGNIDYYVVNSFDQKFEREGFEALGIPRDKLVAGAGHLLSADNLLIPSKVRERWQTPPWVWNFIRSTFLKMDVRHPGTGKSRQIYISRGKALKRRILNEDTVRAVLVRRGFEVVLAEDHSVAEMALLISEASTVFAPHGAGAAHVAFGPANLKLMESYFAHIVPEFWIAVSAAAGQHFLLAGTDDRGRYPWQNDELDGLSEWERNRMHYFIQTEDLDRALDIMIST